MPDALPVAIDTDEDTLPLGTLIKVLPPRDETTGVKIPERGVAITGKLGIVITPVLHDHISVRLAGGGEFHLEPDRVARLHKKAGVQ